MKEWAAVVARHASDDWPPLEWLPLLAEGANDPHEALDRSMRLRSNAPPEPRSPAVRRRGWSRAEAQVLPRAHR